MTAVAKTSVAMTVNGEAVHGEVEPRTLLADFLRDHLRLTGTHIGCAQGVCGACTVVMDGKPQRSCIAFALACEGASIITIEGHDSDPVMAELREAFAAHHALQCGFCTPGMLATARDIVLRLGDVPEARIREELSGNLCRCTGYVGIVDAVRAVCAGKVAQPARPSAPVAVLPVQAVPASPLPSRVPATPLAVGQSNEQRIRINAAPDAVWATLADLRRVAACLPGAEIETIEDGKITGRMRLALGPIKAAFRGQATVALDPAARTGRMAGSGRDGGSAAAGEVRWQVLADGAASLVIVGLSWRLTGALAQFGRAGIVEDVVRRLAASFAANLEAVIRGETPVAKPLGLLAVVWSMIRRKARALPWTRKGQ